MKLRVSVVRPQPGGPSTTRDVALSCDVTATVSDVAHALVRAGLSGDRRLDAIAAGRLAPITLRALPGSGDGFVLLDPMSSVGVSGLQSGWILQPVLETTGAGDSRRLIPIAGSVEVLNGRQRGVQFSLIAGVNAVGRDRSSRVHLLDRRVSRRHAAILADESGLTIVDTGSANGVVVDDRRRTEHRIARATTVRLGDTEIRITPGPAPRVAPGYAHRTVHTRAPRIAPRFPSSSRELPAPPKPAQSGRIPLLAMFAPVLLGAVMFAITRSSMSLMMIAFSPMMMLGSWIDGRLGGRRRFTKDLGRFREELAHEQDELARLRRREIEVRATETPTVEEVKTAIARRDELLWTRRPEHRSFLEVRFGEGALPSRTRLELPKRGETPREQWRMLLGLAESFERVSPVPVIERFERCGSIGVAGDPLWAEGLATSLVLQIVGLHSPYEVVLACFAGPQHAESWGWLKWLPHVDPVASPIPTWQLADTAKSSLRLLTAIEGLLETRSGRGGNGAGGSRSGIRSHLAADARNDDGQGEPVADPPPVPAVVVLVLEDRFVEQSRLIDLGERGPDHGIHLLWISSDPAKIPAACRTFVELGSADGRVNFVRSGHRVPLTRVDHLDPVAAYPLARALAPVEDSAARVLDESDLPRAVHLRELHEVDLLGGGGAIARSWANTGSIVSGWTPGHERPPVPLTAVVGQGPDGPAEIDLRAHGPHALVGGTTGAGKSEFLQTWIMSLAARVSPDRLTFLFRNAREQRPVNSSAAAAQQCHPA